MKPIFISAVILFMLTACGSATPQMTVTSEATFTLTPAATPTPSATPTPALPPELGLDPAKYKMDGDKIVRIEDGTVEANLVDGKWLPIEAATATPEIIKFPVVKIENFHDNPMTYEQGVSGSIDAWLNTLSQPFDPAVINDVPLRNYGGEIMYDTNTAPNFKVKGSEPFHRDIASGELFFEKDGMTYNYIFLPVEYYDKSTGKSYWVKTVSPAYSLGGISARATEEYGKRVWRENMKITPIISSSRKGLNMVYLALTKETKPPCPSTPLKITEF